MSNKMLIDASHPEETRVAVVRGNRIEEFDFESQEKKQLRGNIYLAKVTRVEPSLQAAFVDYGGNRHGFLAFSEIHPDYYQIPVADRQALLEAEAKEARAMREAEEAEDDNKEDTQDDASGDVEASDEGEKEKPKPKSRRRRSSRSKSASKKADEAEAVDEPASDEAGEETTDAKASSHDAQPAEEEKKPKRRSTRRRKVKEEPVSEEASASGNDAAESTKSDDGLDDESGTPTTMAAMVEMDEISEPLPGDEDASADNEEAEPSAEEAEPVEEKPKRKRTARPRKKKAEAKTEEAKADTAGKEAVDTAKAEESTDAADGEAAEDAEEAKPKRRTSRRSPSRKKKPAEAKEAKAEQEDNTAKSGEDDDEGDAPDPVESVGQDDALEELSAQRRNYRQYKIQEVIKRRQVLLIQVVKEERGNKGAALTTYLSLAGRYSVLMPNTARGGGISRKITNSADRKRLKTIASELEVPEGMGVILRTAGAARTKDEIDRDFQYLMRLWEQVRDLTLASTAPSLVYEEGSLIKRSIRDLYNKDTDEIIVSGDEGYKEARDFMGMLMPEHVDRVKQYNGSQAIFTKYGVENHLENMVSPQVTLKSGGYLVINQTEALVAVDVNSGRATREHSVEKTALQTNLEAAEEIARQLRLRDLAGLIVIDFIDMEERRNNRAVEKKLKDCLKNDRARIQVGRISHFGLMEMSRQRIRASVLESTMDVCPHCAGVGFVRSESAIALHVFRALEEHVSRNKNRDAVLKTTPEIAAHLLNHKRAALVELETRYGIQIIILGQGDISGQEFKIEKGGKSGDAGQTNVVGYDGENTSGANNSEEEDGKRKRSRRSRRKGSNDESAEAEATEEQEAGSSEATDNNGEDNKPRRKRRRGKRGGTRRSEADAVTTEENASEQAAAATPSGDSESSTGSEAEVGEKPRSRSTRRKKAPVATKAEQEETPAEATKTRASSDEDDPAPPPPKPRRRTTRRKKPEDSEAITELAAENTDNASVSEPVDASNSADAENGGEEEKLRKKSWWSRGEGFF